MMRASTSHENLVGNGPKNIGYDAGGPPIAEAYIAQRSAIVGRPTATAVADAARNAAAKAVSRILPPILLHDDLCHHAAVLVLEQMTMEEERPADDRIA